MWKFFWSPPKQENLLIFVGSLSICSPEATGDLGILSTNDVDLIVGCLRLLWRLARTARWLNHVSNEKSFRCLGYIEDCTTQLCGDYNTPLYIIIQIPIAQPVQWNAICFFFRGSCQIYYKAKPAVNMCRYPP